MKHKGLLHYALKDCEVSKHVADVYDFDKFVIWCTVHKFCLQERMYPSICKLGS